MGRFNKFEVTIDRTASGRPKGFTIAKDGRVLAKTGSTISPRAIRNRDYTPNLPVQPKTPVEDFEQDEDTGAATTAEAAESPTPPLVSPPQEESLKDRIRKGIEAKMAARRFSKDK